MLYRAYIFVEYLIMYVLLLSIIEKIEVLKISFIQALIPLFQNKLVFSVFFVYYSNLKVKMPGNF